MTTLHLQNYVRGEWFAPTGAPEALEEVASAITGKPVAVLGSQGVDFAAVTRFARKTGGPALRQLTFHQRGKILKDLAAAILARKEELYALSAHTGATRIDGWIDIEGGTGTLSAYASRAKKEMPDDVILLDGPVESLSKGGTFVGQHVFTSRQGVAVHINAFNFPVWGMLEKLAPTLLAGMPAIVKPASATAYVTEACFRIMVESGVLPSGAVQLVTGSAGDLLDHLTSQDVLSFTGSAATAQKLQSHPVIARESVRFVAERDSLNATVLGPDAAPGTPEFDLFVKEVVREMTVKAGQKCTAIRRTFVPAAHIDAAEEAITARLAKVVVGDPAKEGVTMGALVSDKQLKDVRSAVSELAREGRIVFGDLEKAPGTEEGARGAFMTPVLLRCDDPWSARVIHEREAFGPVSTLMPYKDLADAVKLTQRGQGSLVMSLFTHDPAVASEVILGAASWHGRVLISDRDCGKESTGHGSPLPGLVHGGPGRAGGGEELGGLRGVHHYMQRTALQGSPRMLSAIGHRWIEGTATQAGVHPFRKTYRELAIGDVVETASRTVSLEDIEHFAHFTGDTFYAHMDEEAAKANPFFPGRVAHGYLILSFAAGLFVDPAPGPVLANYGLDELRFLKPVSPGDSIKVRLVAKAKKARNEQHGEVRWDALVTNQDGEAVATYELLTLNAM